jgi:hypothetical protein
VLAAQIHCELHSLLTNNTEPDAVARIPGKFICFVLANKCIHRCERTRWLLRKTLGSSFFPCSRDFLPMLDREPYPLALPSMLALPAIAAAKLAASTPSCLTDHRCDGHARKLGGLESAFQRAGKVQGTEVLWTFPACHITFPPYILACAWT